MSEYEQVLLYDVALDAAINAAQEANRAGLDEQEQLIHAIKAYIYTMETQL